MAYLEIHQLRKSFGFSTILNGVDLSIAKGEFVSLLGPSGSGKTTILRCLAGLEFPDTTSGEICIDGRVLSGPQSAHVAPENRHLGMVFQSYAVWPHMNVAANVAFALRVRGGHSRQEIDEKVKRTLELVRLDKLSHRYAHELSGGQQQRVALARALAMSPKALLLDEPLSNLDFILREELGTEIRRLQQELSLTTILVTHDQREALSLSDRIVLLNNGRIEAQGTPEILYANPTTDFSALFISGGQLVEIRGRQSVVLPRRWRVSVQADGDPFRIVSRVFLGSEYEYRAASSLVSEAIRFFSNDRFEIGATVRLAYQ